MNDRGVTTNSGAMVDDHVLEEFEATLRGDVIHAGDEGYDEARTIFNAMIDKRPGIIVKSAGVADVMSSVNFARANDVPLAVRSVGHNVAGISLCDGGIVIDLSPMKGVRVDVETQTVRAEPGLTWGELNHELQPFGLAATGGFISTTGVSGLTLGGGLGWLVRKHGLALDNLLSVDVVTADGRFLTASETQNSELFWGLRGGGGNFGIATSFEFQVHPAGTVLAGLVMHPGAKMKDALRFWREFEVTAPEELTNGAMLIHAPEAPFVPEEAQGAPVVGLGGVYTGSIEKGEKALKSLREFGPPAADLFEPMPFTAAASMADFLFPKGFQNYWKSSFLTELSDSAIDTIVDFYERTPSPMTVIVLEHNGDGAMSRVPEDATAFGFRNWPYNFLVTSIWSDPADADANIQWTRELWEAMQPHLADAVYVNYLGDEGEDRVRKAYPPAKYERLVALKTECDPTNLFRINQNIKPAG
jgi:FAD/FMN-containing dehydrogenase